MINKYLNLLVAIFMSSFLISCSTTDISLQSSIAALSFVDNDKLNNDPSYRELMAYKKLFYSTDPYKYPHTYNALLKHPNWVLRYGAADTIGAHTEPTGNTKIFTKKLLDLSMHDPVLDVRERAISALSNVSTKSDCALYVKLYTTKPEGNPVAKQSSAQGDYKTAIANALKKLDCPETEVLLAPKDMDIVSIMSVLEKENPDSNYNTLTPQGKEAADILYRKNIDDNFNEISKYLNNSNGYVRQSVLQKLGHSKKPEAYPLIVNKLNNDPLAVVRFVAILALRNYKDKRACNELNKFLNNKSYGAESGDFTIKGMDIFTYNSMRDLKCSMDGIKDPR